MPYVWLERWFPAPAAGEIFVRIGMDRGCDSTKVAKLQYNV